MKHLALYLGIAVALTASCTVQEMDFRTPTQDDVVFYASFEQPAEEGTKVYANEDLLLRWTADDRVSIFNKNAYNQQYKFTGETGDNAGGFRKVDTDEFVTGNDIDHVVSVYPYRETTKITESEALTITLPAEQSYAQNSFGLGDNTMVAVSSDNVLQYKNVGGYLMIKIYGGGVSVSSISLKGNNGETLAGKAIVTMPFNGVPTVVMSDDATTEITLTCETPVVLGATVEECIGFWFVLPPVTFTKGFTISITDVSGSVYEQSTAKRITVGRNTLSKMTPFQVEKSNSILYYTSRDGKVVTPYSLSAFGANIVSNEYVNGKGSIIFDGEITSIGDYAFYLCRELTSIIIPDSVTMIGENAFLQCYNLSRVSIPRSVSSIGPGAFSYSGLTSISIPDGIKTIEASSFSYCRSLVDVSIPDSVVSIGESSFFYCTGLVDISIPDSVVSIGESSFYHCTSLKGIIIPNSVTSIEKWAFGECSSLKDIIIPDSVTSIEFGLFVLCENLASICIPESVTSIGAAAFSGCSSLTSAIIPDSVTSIGEDAFASCSSLSYVNMPQTITSIGARTFTCCFSLTSIILPKGLTTIGWAAFNECKGLSSVTIPDKVTIIDGYAFYGCSNLTCITVLPKTPPSIGNKAFDDTSNAPIYVPVESVEIYRYQVGIRYSDRIFAMPTMSVPVPETIDMGLSVKWASFNLGASVPEEYGDYYAWGETESKTDYSWSTYKWCETPLSFTKYNDNITYGIIDNKNSLEAQDDVIQVKLGGKWRMPTYWEWMELCEYCTWTSVNQNGINGRLVTSPNGNSIFLPAAGCRMGTDTSEDSCGFYWSSTLGFNDPSCALSLGFGLNDVLYEGKNRFYGFSVRPVYAE